MLTDYETSWYASNKAAYDLVKQGALGLLTKAVVRGGHNGPAKIHVPPEFFSWLTDPKENGAGALYDFGCYGADLMTWLLNGEASVSVSAFTKHLQPAVYPKVDDEADVLLNYRNQVAILQGSWTWPFNVLMTWMCTAQGVTPRPSDLHKSRFASSRRRKSTLARLHRWPLPMTTLFTIWRQSFVATLMRVRTSPH